jgi:hypothetical protein
VGVAGVLLELFDKIIKSLARGERSPRQQGSGISIDRELALRRLGNVARGVVCTVDGQ